MALPTVSITQSAPPFALKPGRAGGALTLGLTVSLTAGEFDLSVASVMGFSATFVAFLGQTVISPGRFSPWGVFVATYFLVTSITGLQLLGGAGWVQDVFYGGALVIAVTLARLVARRRQA